MTRKWLLGEHCARAPCDFPHIPSMHNLCDIVKYVSHALDRGSKCDPFIGRRRVACHTAIKPRPRASRPAWIICHRGPVKASDGYVFLFFLASLSPPDTWKEMLFVFLRMRDFLPFIPSESSCRLLRPSGGGFRRPLAAAVRLPPGTSGGCVGSGRKTDQFAEEGRGYSEKTLAGPSQFSNHTEHQSSRSGSLL